jgi:hypothetical protein
MNTGLPGKDPDLGARLSRSVFLGSRPAAVRGIPE